MIIYLDESGDLGFNFAKPKTSRKFVITLLVCDNKVAVESFRKAVRRTLRNKINRGKETVHEIKGVGTSQAIKTYFYRNLPNNGWRVYAVILNKQRVYEYLKGAAAKKKLYNFLARFIVERVDLSKASPAVTLIIDRCKNREEIRDFNSYIENQLGALLPLNIPLNIYHENSQSNAGLQAVDLFCWGIFRKYEMNDVKWYEVFKKDIALETEYLRSGNKKDGPYYADLPGALGQPMEGSTPGT